MRVISGIRKGHKLKTPKNNNIRPTEDRIKESLFNIIGHIGNDWVILDGFAGTGSIGIEFLSRGAKFCYFVDLSKDSIAIIKENLGHTKLMEFAKVINDDIFTVIKQLNNQEIKFKYIYFDPPFRQDGIIEKLLESINSFDILDKDGVILIEHEKEFQLKKDLNHYNICDYRKYGSKAITFLKKN